TESKVEMPERPFQNPQTVPLQRSIRRNFHGVSVSMNPEDRPSFKCWRGRLLPPAFFPALVIGGSVVSLSRGPVHLSVFYFHLCRFARSPETPRHPSLRALASPLPLSISGSAFSWAAKLHFFHATSVHFRYELIEDL